MTIVRFVVRTLGNSGIDDHEPREQGLTDHSALALKLTLGENTQR
ncbi:hypothetical protein GCM10009716_42870 [Streptomyces sodiiphilus]|uniref:Uncharacterized protein n=1 Tax=Streptomyces sodiiphilus TaxID=226217 RepID=A0ABN2PTT3_9ACTN